MMHTSVVLYLKNNFDTSFRLSLRTSYLLFHHLFELMNLPILP